MRASLPARMDELRAKGVTRQIPLIVWLEMSEGSMCTDLKDKFYALVGLASDCQNNKLAVNYSTSMSLLCFGVLKLYFPKFYLRDDLSHPECLKIYTANILHFSHCLFKWLRIDLEDDRSIETYYERSPEARVWIRGMYCGSIAVLGQYYETSPSEVTGVRAGLLSECVLISSERLNSVRPISSGMSCAFRSGEWERSMNGIYRWLFGYTKGPGNKIKGRVTKSDQEYISFDNDQSFVHKDSTKQSLFGRSIDRQTNPHIVDSAE